LGKEKGRGCGNLQEILKKLHFVRFFVDDYQLPRVEKAYLVYVYGESMGLRDFQL